MWWNEPGSIDSACERTFNNSRNCSTANEYGVVHNRLLKHWLSWVDEVPAHRAREQKDANQIVGAFVFHAVAILRACLQIIAQLFSSISHVLRSHVRAASALERARVPTTPSSSTPPIR